MKFRRCQGTPDANRRPQTAAAGRRASDRASASGRRRTPSPVASTTCPPCPILNITWPGAPRCVVLESRAAPGSHGIRARARRTPPSARSGVGGRGYPTHHRRRDPGGRTNRGLYGPNCRPVNTDNDSQRTHKRRCQRLLCRKIARSGGESDSDDQLARRSPRTCAGCLRLSLRAG
jgi:hypothetical protein